MTVELVLVTVILVVMANEQHMKPLYSHIMELIEFIVLLQPQDMDIILIQSV